MSKANRNPKNADTTARVKKYDWLHQHPAPWSKAEDAMRFWWCLLFHRKHHEELSSGVTERTTLTGYWAQCRKCGQLFRKVRYKVFKP